MNYTNNMHKALAWARDTPGDHTSQLAPTWQLIDELENAELIQIHRLQALGQPQQWHIELTAKGSYELKRIEHRQQIKAGAHE